MDGTAFSHIVLVMGEQREHTNKENRISKTGPKAEHKVWSSLKIGRGNFHRRETVKIQKQNARVKGLFSIHGKKKKKF